VNVAVLPEWSHFYWAMHVQHHFESDEVAFMPHLDGQDFILARRWWLGASCRVPVAKSGSTTSSDMDRKHLLAHVAKGRDPPHSTWLLRRHKIKRSSAHAVAAQAPPLVRLVHSPLADQCPSTLREGGEVVCAWNHPVCMKSEHSKRVDALLRLGKGLMKGIKTTTKCFSP
jgi:hypothetical protein